MGCAVSGKWVAGQVHRMLFEVTARKEGISLGQCVSTAPNAATL